MEEVWKDIKDYEGIYQVSNLGRIKYVKLWQQKAEFRKESWKKGE